METSKHGQVTYPQEAAVICPDGCLADEDYSLRHGGCMDGDGCRFCVCYYDGLEALEDWDKMEK